MCFILLWWFGSIVESGTLGLELGALIVMVTKLPLATLEVLEVPKPLEVLI